MSEWLNFDQFKIVYLDPDLDDEFQRKRLSLWGTKDEELQPYIDSWREYMRAKADELDIPYRLLDPNGAVIDEIEASLEGEPGD
jgi:hypothetical protein